MQNKATPTGLKKLDYSVLQQCMHCGMCLPTCPTYMETLNERHSPRGRISLMKAVVDEELELTEAFGKEMYYCLGCLACTSSCPADVDYATMFEAARSDIEENQILKSSERKFWRWLLVKTIFMRPVIVRLFGKSMWFYQASGLQSLLRKIGFMKLLPKKFRDLEPLTPEFNAHSSDTLIKPIEKPKGKVRYQVGFLTGCIQDIAFSHTNRATVDVLLHNDCEVVTPRKQGCCGSLHAHNGENALATELAKKAIDAFDLDKLDAIISNAGGCGSHLKHYSKLLANDPEYAFRARLWDSKVKDIHEWLDTIGMKQPPALKSKITATYHHSCHLCHGQGVVQQPEKLLSQIPGLELIPLEESKWCCGSAGIYNITQPVQAAKLLDRKMKFVQSTHADLVLTANTGCDIQLSSGVQQMGMKAQVMHPIELIAKAYKKEAI